MKLHILLFSRENFLSVKCFTSRKELITKAQHYRKLGDVISLPPINIARDVTGIMRTARIVDMLHSGLLDEVLKEIENGDYD